MRHETDPTHFTLTDLLDLDTPPGAASTRPTPRGCLSAVVLACLLWAGLILGAVWLASLMRSSAYQTLTHPW